MCQRFRAFKNTLHALGLLLSLGSNPPICLFGCLDCGVAVFHLSRGGVAPSGSWSLSRDPFDHCVTVSGSFSPTSLGDSLLLAHKAWVVFAI